MNPISLEAVCYALFKDNEQAIRDRQAEGGSAILITKREFRRALTRYNVTINRNTANSKWDACVDVGVIIEDPRGCFIVLSRLCYHAKVPNHCTHTQMMGASVETETSENCTHTHMMGGF